jgi:hypothetical protein
MEYKSVIETYESFQNLIKEDYSDFLEFTIDLARQKNSEFPATIVKICLYSKDIEEADGYVKLDEGENAIIIFREKETDTTNFRGWAFWSDLQRQNEGLPSHPSECGKSLSKEEAFKHLSMEK